MKNYLFEILIILIAFSSCTTKYQSIAPRQFKYPEAVYSDGVGFTYNYEVFTSKYNRGFKRKELKNEIQIVGVRITNYTDSILTLGDNLQIYADTTPIEIVTPEIAGQRLRQDNALFMLYLLLGPLKLKSTNKNDLEKKEKAFPVGFIIGPSLSLASYGSTAFANEKFKKELLLFSPKGKAIMPKSELTGLIAIKVKKPLPLKIKQEH